MTFWSRPPSRVLTAALAAAALGLAACSDDATLSSEPQPATSPQIAPGEGAPAANAAQADRIVGSGRAAFDRRMEALRGHPVVVNQWASWCTTCRVEFPYFKAATERFADRVAFLGLDSRDDRGAAEAFQAEVPAGFPSVFDEDASVARDLGGGTSWPTTFFFDAEGELVHVRLGAYATAEQLADDIARFALGAT